MSGVGLIPWSKVVEYGAFHEMTKDQIYFMIEAIQKVDMKYMHYQMKEQKALMNKK